MAEMPVTFDCKTRVLNLECESLDYIDRRPASGTCDWEGFRSSTLMTRHKYRRPTSAISAQISFPRASCVTSAWVILKGLRFAVNLQIGLKLSKFNLDTSAEGDFFQTQDFEKHRKRRTDFKRKLLKIFEFRSCPTLQFEFDGQSVNSQLKLGVC
ncbi:hypothetical protein R3P38DRAFT_3342458 [Favolaschia claudopus]|uniref:Uncharacterized protein n=1 Tax=Favolaschia claudopus TaxID=2862362 RepID=A0AAW0DUH2_9AGAR